MPSVAFKNIIPDLSAAWAPPPKLSLYEWAEQFAYLSPESAAEPGKWRAFPYQRGIMEAYSDPRVSKITFRKSARVGYTKILNHIVGYHIHEDPCNILIVQPTIEDAQGHSKDEIAPMIRDTPCLSGVVADVREKNSDNTILKKAYPGGRLYLVGANSPRGFRRISARVVLFDEVDGYPPSAGTEGDQIKLGTKRSEFFWNRKILIGSTPTDKDLSRVDASFSESDQQFYYVPCPICGHMQDLIFENLKWPKGEPEKARFECIGECKKLIDHSKKRWMIERGIWRAKMPFNGHMGFSIWSAYSYSPNATWPIIATEFYEAAKKKDFLEIKTVVNTTLGRSYEEKGERPSWETLKDRCEPYEWMTVPAGGQLITAGVDTQDNRLEIVVRAWGAFEKSWLIYYDVFYGDPAEGEVFERLDKVLNYPFPREDGGKLLIMSLAIDAMGHRTQAVYNYARRRYPRVMAIQGGQQANTPVLKPTPTFQDVTYGGKLIKKGVRLWTVGSSTAKQTIYSRLALTKGPGVYHWPDGTPEEYFKQLTAEKLLTRRDKKGRNVQEWVKIRDRNEVLDCEGYCYAAAIRAGVMTLTDEPAKPPATRKEEKKTGSPIERILEARRSAGGYKRPDWLNR